MARLQLHTGIKDVPSRSILMELQAGDLKNPMADYSTTAGRTLILFPGGCWARCQLHAGIKYVPTRSILMKLQAGDLKNLMADYSTTAGRILILFPGACRARRQLHAGIRYVSVAPKHMKLLSSVEGVRVVALAKFYSMADSSTTAV